MSRHSESVFQDFGESLNVSSLRILSRPKPDIFLCGGADPNRSVRHLFMQFAQQNCEEFFSRLVLAENVIKSWFRADNYNNLLELEEDLASVASIVPIFLESPGSFAEVGSFASNKNLIKKVLVFQDTKYKDAESFINLGPLHRIRNTCGTNDVLCYSWDDVSLYFSDIKDNILEKLNIKEKTFYPNNIGDISILVIEILGISQLAKRDDIKRALNSSGININYSKLNKILYLLEKMNCIKETHAGKSRYYMSLCKDRMLRLSFKHNAPTRDILEWKYRISKHYSSSDKNWERLWSSLFKEGGQN